MKIKRIHLFLGFLTLIVISILIGTSSCKEEKKADDFVQISGIYPHLAMFDNGRECGVGAVVPWTGKLWTITYAPHFPFGSESNKLYSITNELKRNIRPESIGGTPANRMIHRESNQLFIGPYAIDDTGGVRVIPYEKIPGRATGNARHLSDPQNKIYYATMEEGFYEINVHDLSVNTLYKDGNQLVKEDSLETIDSPILPGYHGKGLYSGQGRLIYSNNGEHDWAIKSSNNIKSGCLAEWKNGKWNVVRRAQFTEVMGPGNIFGNKNPELDPVWSIGWDHKSLILMVLDNNKWYSYRLPKASHCYDGAHGHHTEWPRISDIGKEDFLMTMHGTFWHFPDSFSHNNSGGIAPYSTYLKVIGDFCRWNNHLVFGCDDAAKSTFKNTRKIKNEAAEPGQSQSNLWFVEPDKLDKFGPPLGRGAVWIKENLKQGAVSEPYLFNGYSQRMVHLSHQSNKPVNFHIEIDRNGSGEWEILKTIEVPSRGYNYHIFNRETTGEWIRIRTDSQVESATAFFNYSGNDRRNSKVDPIFDGLSTTASENKSGAILWPLGNNQRTLGLDVIKSQDESTKHLGYYELDSTLNLKKQSKPKTHARVREAAPKEHNIRIDKASAIVKDNETGKPYRLPKFKENYVIDTSFTWPRIAREVVTERDLMNCAGTFYELPESSTSGGIGRIRPIASHNFRIYDFVSYRGLLILSGVKSKDKYNNNKHIITSKDGDVALWAGTIDDLWKLGKPRGIGGPWKNSKVKAREASDPYLMAGYDKKEMLIEHNAEKSINFQVEVDLTGKGLWKTYKNFKVKRGESLKHKFPEGYSAYWVRLRADHNCEATATFTYK